jgi:hypothetical protein
MNNKIVINGFINIIDELLKDPKINVALELKDKTFDVLIKPQNEKYVTDLCYNFYVGNLEWLRELFNGYLGGFNVDPIIYFGKTLIMPLMNYDTKRNVYFRIF